VSKNCICIARVTNCSVAAPRDLIELFVDRPVEGTGASIDEFIVSGWIKDDNCKLTALLSYESGKYISLPFARTHRADLAGTTKDNKYGFTTSMNLRTRGYPTEVVLHAELNGEREKARLCTITFAYVDLPVVSARNPVLLTAMGRSGTSYLMGLLAGHPAIATPSLFPFEERIATYFADVYRAITRTGAAEKGLRHHFGVGHRSYPSNDLIKPGLLKRMSPEARFEFSSEMLVSSANAIRSFIDLYYSNFTGTKPDQTPIFAEKMIGYFATQEILCSIFDNVFEIILVRDFRDAFTSAMMFNRKRNYAGFGAERSNSEIEWLEHFSADAKQVMIASQERPNSLIVKYEEFVNNPFEILQRLFSSIGISHDAEIVTRCIEKFQSNDYEHHKTSTSSENSISRWQRDMPRELVGLANEMLEEPLCFFGYV
jgi:Sulfotransferase family